MSKLYVVKFGGSSVATTARIKHVSDIVSKLVLKGNRVVVVTSAMQGVTNQLIDFTRVFQESPVNREYDAIISSGEQVAAGLLAMCLESMGVKSKSFVSWQIPINVDGIFSNAFIDSVDRSKILDSLENGITPVIAGFQGISKNGDIMTIGRGGSDATACAISHAINADECFIYTDVDGVYSADPRIVLNSKRLKEISYNEMIELASNGAKVLQSKSVLIAKNCNVKLRVLSSFQDDDGGETMVTNETVYIPKDKNIAGVAHNMGLSKATIFGINDAGLILSKINSPELISINGDSLSFLFPKTSLLDVKSIIEKNNLLFEIDNDIGVVSIVGSGIKTDNSILNIAISIISANGIKLKQITVSEISISIVVPLGQTNISLNLLHEKFFG